LFFVTLLDVMWISELTVTTKVSGQVPPVGSEVEVGPTVEKVSKSSRSQQTSATKIS
jgi:hypothetical protein